MNNKELYTYEERIKEIIKELNAFGFSISSDELKTVTKLIINYMAQGYIMSYEDTNGEQHADYELSSLMVSRGLISEKQLNDFLEKKYGNK